jgi:hypothetical protein
VKTGRVGLQVLGLGAVAACLFVVAAAPGSMASASSFQGSFTETAASSQNLNVIGALSVTAVSRDGYSSKAAPPPPVIVASSTGSSGSSSSGCPSSDAAVADPSGAQAIAAGLAAERGWTGAEFDALVALWSRESGWRVNAANSSSCAYGIPQALPGSKMASVGADWLTNPATQITWGLNYIQGGYGDPIAALAHSDSAGWY